MKKQILLTIFIFVATILSAQTIEWRSIEQAYKENADRIDQGLEPKLIFIDVYTNWCGWCKRMDATTFAHPVIAKYMNDTYISVKFNAEGDDSVRIANEVFLPKKYGKSHEFAVALMGGQMSFPTYILLTMTAEKSLQIVQKIPGYQQPQPFEAMLHYFGGDAWKTTNFATFQQTFVGEIK
jgi:thioredoxin-related protein